MPLYSTPIFAVAPMIDWSDRHFRYLARQLSHHALLYTEMVVADAILRGNREKLLGFDHSEHPVALQLGGNDPVKLAEAARIGADFGYDEINMNVGCPSDRVQSGTFGACLMREPETVAACVAAMKAVVDVPVTIKCRIGVDDQDAEVALRDLLTKVVDAGVDAVWVHARKAWLQGLSPKENRDVPPLDYALVYRVKAEHPSLFMGINGGVTTLEQAQDHLKHVDGVMMGRSAYHDSALLTGVDQMFPHPRTRALGPVEALTPSGHTASPEFWATVRDAMMIYADRHIASGGRLIHVTRHMVGLFQGWPGARRFRQILSTDATKAGAGSAVIAHAFDAIFEASATQTINEDTKNGAV